MKLISKTAASLLSIIMAVALIPAGTVFADNSSGSGASDSTEIHISTVREFKDLADNCHLDSWSQDKTVILDNDLDLSAADSSILIATFGGTFDGNGHKITGLKIVTDSDEYALFGIVQKSGVIKNLTVEDTITPTEKRENVGGIAEINYGRITGCAFNGTVSADARVGGIAGYNKKSGSISKCTSEGSITGDSFTGGIAGYNAGKISSCENTAYVNTEYTDTTVTIEDISDTVENILRTGDINGTENVSARTDTGGIAGFSSGTVSSCTNRGMIGYEHVGYNVGGIAGRSTGFLKDSENQGIVYGRKDVGGIAGQMEPSLKLIFDEDDIKSIRNQISDLNSAVGDALSDAQSFSSDTTDSLKKLNSYLKDAEGSSEDIIDSAKDYAGDAVDKLNDAGDAVSDAVAQTRDSIKDSIDTALDYADDVEKEISKLTDAGQALIANADLYGISDTDKKALQNDLDDITDRVTSIDNAVKDLKKIKKAILKDPLTVTQYFDAAVSDIKTIRKSVKGSSDTLVSMLQIIDKVSGEFTKATTSGVGKTSSGTGTGSSPDSSASAADGSASSAETGSDGSASSDNTGSSSDSSASTDNTGNSSDSSASSDNTGSSSDSSASSDNSGNSSDSNVGRIVQNIKDSDLNKEIDALQKLIENYPDISIDTKGIDKIAGADLDIDLDDSDIEDSKTDLYDSLSGINSEMDDLADAVTSESGSLADTLTDINDRLDALSNSINDMYDKATSESADIEDHIKDISEKDIDGSKKGRTTGCTNTGTVRSDLNGGGIVGTIGIEYDLDPERDIQQVGNTNIDYVFNAKSIVDRCVNHGEITTRNNYAAGIAAHMELGTVYKCENYGDITGGGDYTGGISGYSVGSVNSDYAKGQLSGNKYVGGITGYGKTIKNCVSMVEISDSKVYKGAVAGSVEDVNSSDISDNYYVSGSIYGIDDVSYKGMAEGISYEKTMDIEGVPDTFRTIQLIFKADDEVVDIVYCPYGEDLPESKVPRIPGKDGYNSRWNKSDFKNITENQTITAIYSRVVTLIGSDLTRSNGRNILLAKGNFDTGSSMRLTKDNTEGTETERWIVGIPDDGSDTHEFRYLAPDGESDLTALYIIDENGKREKAELSSMGEYLSFTTDKTSFRLAAEVVRNPIKKILTIAGTAAAVIAVLFILFKIMKRLRTQKKHREKL